MVPRGLAAGALQVLPEGLVVPPLPYLAGLAVTLAVVAGSLNRLRPAVTSRVIVAFAPWMVTGAALHALYQLGSAPTVVAPLFTAPTVYATTFGLAGAVWAGVARLDTGSVAGRLGGVGLVAATITSGAVLQAGATRGTLSPMLPVIGLGVSVALTGAVYWLVRAGWPSVLATTGDLGLLVVFGHVLDGVSTTIGVDLMGATERSPIPQTIMEVAGALPTAGALGTGWLFVLVKVGVAVAVLALFADFVEEDPVQGNVGLGVVAAVGLGPGAQNLLLFAAAGPV